MNKSEETSTDERENDASKNWLQKRKLFSNAGLTLYEHVRSMQCVWTSSMKLLSGVVHVGERKKL